MFFLPRVKEERDHCLNIIKKYFEKFELKIIVDRDVPINKKVLGKSIIGKEPAIAQIFVQEVKTFSKNKPVRIKTIFSKTKYGDRT